jgi:hypothetical protein
MDVGIPDQGASMILHVLGTIFLTYWEIHFARILFRADAREVQP